MYSALYAHLSKVLVKEGDVLKYGDKIGIMGHTGYVEPSGPAGTHLHVGVVDGYQNRLWRLANMARGNPIPNKEESDWIVTGDDLFITQAGEPRKNRITTDWLGYKNHSAYDIVDVGSGLPFILWNRGLTFDMPAKVAKVGYDEGYGHYVILWYSYGELWDDPINPGDIVKIDKAAADQIFGNEHLVIEGPEADGITWVRIGVSDKWIK